MRRGTRATSGTEAERRLPAASASAAASACIAIAAAIAAQVVLKFRIAPSVPARAQSNGRAGR